MAAFSTIALVAAGLAVGVAGAQIIGGGGGKPPSLAPAPTPVTSKAPEIDKAREAQRKAQALTRERSSSILTSPSGVLGDPPLDRPSARAGSTLLG